jgi:hypothetical protein
MLALLTQCGGGKGVLRRLGPFIEQIGVGTKLEIDSCILLEAGAQVRPAKMPGRGFEREEVALLAALSGLLSRLLLLLLTKNSTSRDVAQ